MNNEDYLSFATPKGEPPLKSESDFYPWTSQERAGLRSGTPGFWFRVDGNSDHGIEASEVAMVLICISSSLGRSDHRDNYGPFGTERAMFE